MATEIKKVTVEIYPPGTMVWAIQNNWVYNGKVESLLLKDPSCGHIEYDIEGLVCYAINVDVFESEAEAWTEVAKRATRKAEEARK